MSEATVFVVDDDTAVLDSIARLLQSHGHTVRTFTSPITFLSQVRHDWTGCLLLDVRLPSISGLDMQREMSARDIKMPVIILTGYGNVANAVEAMRGGALDFLEKPFDEQELLDRVRDALDFDALESNRRQTRRELRQNLVSLTHREREVLERVIDGYSNRRIAAALQITEKTVEAHRSQVMRKMHVNSLAELVRACIALGLRDEYKPTDPEASEPSEGKSIDDPNGSGSSSTTRT
jgi:FixJ family two-component response regulator